MLGENEVLTTSDFEYVRKLAKTNAAIIIDDDKRYLVETRLSPLAEQTGYSSLAALIQALRGPANDWGLKNKIIDALTTNETLFFRDGHVFDALAETVLPRLVKARASEKRLHIWSAAASTGQEAYSLAMLIRSKFPELQTWNVSIIGTDISDTVLAQARSCSYSQHEVSRGLPEVLLKRYFTASGNRWVINPDLRSMVEFRSMNLISNWSLQLTFDLVLIRNVLIYFDDETRRGILTRVARQLAADGCMLLGTAETPMLASRMFRTVQAGRAVFYEPTGV